MWGRGFAPSKPSVAWLSPSDFDSFPDAMTNRTLADRNCVPCRGGVPPLKGNDLAEIHRHLADHAQWTIINEHHLVRTYKFPDFKSALSFVNKVGAVAEEQGHHPDILLAWGKAEVTMWTHKIDGLTESDFIMAAKIDRVFKG